MLTTVGIKDAEFFAYHGYHDEEQKMGNHFIINSSISIDIDSKINDALPKTINYETLYTICKIQMENAQSLLETVAENILAAYKNEFPLLKSATIKINKLQPQLGGKLHSSFVEMKI